MSQLLRFSTVAKVVLAGATLVASAGWANVLETTSYGDETYLLLSQED